MNDKGAQAPVYVRLETNEFQRGQIDQIVVFIGDLRLTKDIVSERDILLAYRLADESGVPVQDNRRNNE